MPEPKTEEEIQVEIAAMETLRPRLANAHYQSGIGNFRVFEIQLLALRQRWDGFDVQERYGYPRTDTDENYLLAAHEAVLWMAGQSKYDSLAKDYPVFGIIS